MVSLRSLVVSALAGLMLVAAPVHAQLVSEGVIYAYMTMRVGDVQQPVIMPIATEQVRPDLPLQSTIPAAFGLLRYGKPATYGNASVTISDALLAQERVAVNLDPATDASTFEVIAAETVLTFTALGIDTVVFPGWADEGLQASDIHYATYRAQVPMWQALVGGSVHGADIVLPNGDRVDAIAFYDDLEDGDDDLQEMVLDAVANGGRVPQYYLLGVLGGLDIDGYEAVVVPLLTDEDPNYRAAALGALAPSTDEDAWDAVVTMMGADADPQIRAMAAAAVAASPLESYHVYEVFYRAGSEDPTVRNAAIADMGQMDDPRVVEQLRTLLGSQDAAVRQSAADALHGLEAWAALEDAMADDALESNVRLVAATALANDASGDAQLAGIVYRGMNTVGDVATASLDRIAALSGVDTVEAFEGFLAHSDVAVAVYAAGLLADAGDEDSLDALSAVGQDESRPLDLRYAAGDAAFGILSGFSSSRIGDYADGNDPFLKRSAYRALGALAAAGNAGSSVFSTLSDGLQSSDPGVRGASARALASYGTQEALDLIMTVEADPSSDVRADVALAMAGFPGEAFADTVSPTVVGYVESGDPVVVAAALDALASLEQSQLLSVVLDKVRFPDARVRASAMRAAADLADPNDLRPVINAIGAGLQDDELSNRVLSAQLLGRFNDGAAVLTLSQAVNGLEPELRFAAIAALGNTQNPDAVGPLLALLEDPEREVRLAAVESLRVLNLTSAIPGVQAQLARESDAVSVEALEALVEHLTAQGS